MGILERSLALHDMYQFVFQYHTDTAAKLVHHFVLPIHRLMDIENKSGSAIRLTCKTDTEFLRLADIFYQFSVTAQCLGRDAALIQTSSTERAF